MLKLKDGFILRSIAGQNIVIPSGDDMDLNMMITLNGTGAFLWKHLEQGAEEADLVQAILDSYSGVDQERAQKAVDTFLTTLKEHDFLI